MVNVSHDGYDRGAWNEIVLIVLSLLDSLAHLGTHVFSRESKLVGNEVDSLGIETLVDRHHNTHAHASADNLVDRHIHHGGKFADSHKLGELQCLALCCLLLQFLVKALLHSLALLTAILGTLLVLILTGETGQCLLHLACNVLLVHLNRFRLAVLLVLLAASVIAVVVIIVITVAIAVIAATIIVAALVLLFLSSTVVTLVDGSLDVNALLIDALALFLFAVHLCGFFLALLSALLLRLLLRTGALVERREVNLAKYVHLRGEFLFTLKGVNLIIVVIVFGSNNCFCHRI